MDFEFVKQTQQSREAAAEAAAAAAAAVAVAVEGVDGPEDGSRALLRGGVVGTVLFPAAGAGLCREGRL